MKICFSGLPLFCGRIVLGFAVTCSGHVAVGGEVDVSTLAHWNESRGSTGAWPKAAQPPLSAALQGWGLDAELRCEECPGVRASQQGPVRFIALDPGAVWELALESPTGRFCYVMLALNASCATSVDVGSASVQVVPNDGTEFAEMRVATRSGGAAPEWKPLIVPYRIPLERFSNQQLAVLPLLTFRLDADAGTWALFCGRRAVTENLPLTRDEREKQGIDLKLEAGPEGALLCGIAVTANNPFFADANGNSMCDKFEAQQSQSGPGWHAFALAQWEEWLSGQPPLKRYARPVPDRFVGGAGDRSERDLRR